MAFSVVVMEPPEFHAWLEAQGQVAARPTDPLARRGETAFLANGCSACHAIRGTPAVARIGPDLTHVGSRLHIGAQTLPNDRPALIRWIGDAGRVKPGAHMPAFRALEADEIEALAAYMDALQ
jgi:cytochrome c oxidase subunit 2